MEYKGEGEVKQKMENLRPKEIKKCLHIQINLEIFPEISHIVENIHTGTIYPLVFSSAYVLSYAIF